MDHQALGLLDALDGADWSPRFRPLPELRERILVLSHLSAAMDGLSNGDERAFSEGIDRFVRLGIPPARLEHPELAILAALGEQTPPPAGARTQMGWRSVAAAALGWAMGLYEDFEESVECMGEQTHGFEGSRPDAPFHIEKTRGLRELAEVRGALGAMREQLPYASGAAHDILVEQIKALRWLTEPWWPELALVPWREGDQLSPTTEDAFSVDAMHARTVALANAGVDPAIRSPEAVANKAMSIFLAGQIAMQQAAGMDSSFTLELARLANVSADEPDVEALMRILQSTAPHPDLLRRVSWLISAADALFWALGLFADLPDGDPPESAYEPLAAIVGEGAWPVLARQAGLRSQDAILEEWRRWDAHRHDAATPQARATGVERCRALRWILQPWPTIAETPWDASDEVKPFTHPDVQ
jgi:hypothetical protein